MLHVATVHWRSPAWIETQLAYVRRFTPSDTQVWASLDEIDVGPEGFDQVTSSIGTHGEKLDELGRQICAAADATDGLLFLDGDAWPVRPLDRLLCSEDSLIAVRRDENRHDRQPHPCFTLTTVGFWQEIDGTWAHGYVSEAGAEDVGGALLRTLEERAVAWRALTRLNRVDLHPLWFAVYGDDQPVVYHHGAGFRPRVDRADRAPSNALIPASVPILGRAERSMRWRWKQRAIYRKSYQRPAEQIDAEVRGWIASDENIVDRFV
jgi:hypothetical protein